MNDRGSKLRLVATFVATSHAEGVNAGRDEQRQGGSVRANEPDKTDGFEAIATLEDLGKYLQELRRKRHVTQESLSTKTGAITGRKIARSRISEIENAKRDPVTEQELRGYMRALTCTPRRIDQVVSALTQCATAQARGSLCDSDATSPTPDAYPGGLGGVEGDLVPLEEKSDDNPATAIHGGKRRERWQQINTCINPVAAPPPQPSRRRRQRDRIALTAATALVVVALVGPGVEISPRAESRDRSTSPGIPATLFVQHSAPHISEDASAASNFKDVLFPAGAPARVNQQFTKTSVIRHGGWEGAAGRDAPQESSGVVSVTPCGVTLVDRRRAGKTPQCRSGNIVGSGAPAAPGKGAVIDPSRSGASPGAARGLPFGLGDRAGSPSA